MEIFKVCRVCLVTNTTLYNLHSNSLEFYYELLTGMNPLLELNLPMLTCLECTALLKKFSLFREKCLRGQGILESLFQKHGKITEGYIKEIDRERVLLKSSLSICDASFIIDINSDYDNENIYMEDAIIKNEAEPIDDNAEIEYEFKYDIVEEWSSDDELPISSINIQSHKKDMLQQELFLEEPSNFDEPEDKKLQEHKEEKKENITKKRKRARLTSPKSDTHMKVANGMVEKVNIDSHMKKVILTKKEQREEFEKRRESESYQRAPFKCDLCLKPFLFKKTLENHAIRHDKASGKHKCDMCQVYFKLLKRYNLHMMAHSTKFFCNTCNYKARELRKAKLHVLWHKGFVYKCPHCDYVHSKYSSYITHLRIKHATDHICALCGNSFVSQLGLSQHKAIMHRSCNFDEPGDEKLQEHKEEKENIRKKAKRLTSPNLDTHMSVVNVNIDSHMKKVILTKKEQREEFEKRWESESYQRAPFKCDICLKPFLYEKTLENHAIKHDKASGKHKCDMCQVYFKLLKRYNLHMMAHSTKFFCNTCNFEARDLRKAKLHVLWHKGFVYKCPHCDYVRSNYSSYVKHVRVKHATDHICALCGNSFISQLGLSQHKAKMHRSCNEIEANSEAPYCEDCDVRFASEEAHRRHLLTAKRHAHENPKRRHVASGLLHNSISSNEPTWPFNCPHCSEEITNVQRCFWHFSRNHPNEKYPLDMDFVCEFCGRAFCTQGSLMYHKRCKHEQSRPATCPTCGKTFASPKLLKKHAHTHSAARPHVCECGKTYKTKSVLARHMEVVHNGQKRYKCKLCGKAFPYSTGCDTHYRTVHLGERGPPRIRNRTKTCTSRTKDSVMARTSRTKDSVKARTSRTKDSVKARTSRTKAVTCPSPDSSPGGSSSDASTGTSS